VRDVEDRLQIAARGAEENEDRREQTFRDHEEERRDDESTQRREEIWQDLEQWIGGPPEVNQVGDGEVQSIAPTVRIVVQKAASRHAADIMDTVRAEREELVRKREAAQAEQETLLADADAERARRNQEREARIQALEYELAAVKDELENVRQQ
jgi:hypothetical protein